LRANEEQALAVGSNGLFAVIRAPNRARPKIVRGPWTDGDEKGSACPMNVIQRGAELLSRTMGARYVEISCPIVRFARAKTLEHHKKIYNEKFNGTHREARIGSNFSRLLVAREQLQQACLP